MVDPLPQREYPWPTKPAAHTNGRKQTGQPRPALRTGTGNTGQQAVKGVFMKRFLAVLAILLAGTGLVSAQKDRSDIRIVVVSHGAAADPFWSVAKNGVDQAAKDMGVTVEYHAPETFDMARMAQLIDAAIASRPDGLVVSIPDADALGGVISDAVEAGIPVMSMNSGVDEFEELGVIAHIGQTEYEAGFGAGEQMAEAGITNAVCVKHE